jgi:hypothetical protein
MQLRATVRHWPLAVTDLTETTGLGAGLYADLFSALDSLRYTQTPLEPGADQVHMIEN